MNSYKINLLPKRQEKIADKLIYFVLYYFRYIIVITQIVVIAVFFYRFREDQKITDLKESFRQRQQILAQMAPLVDDARIIERKTNQVKVILDEQTYFDKQFSTVIENVPQDVSLERLTINERGMQMSGVSTNVFTIRALHKRITLIEGLESAIISTVNRVSDTAYDFTIEVNFETDG